MIGGHEGAGVVEEVGPDVRGLAPGDRIIFSFIPACGRCDACSRGMQNLCELGMYLGDGTQISDHTARHHARGQDLGLMCLLGTFAEHTVVSEANCVKIDDDIPLDTACLLGCGVITGWGGMVYTGELKANETAVVVGIGGIGINAIQGAVMAGAKYTVAVDPVEFKRTTALEFGATHAVATSEEATELIRELTRGRMANVIVNTMGVGVGEQIGVRPRDGRQARPGRGHQLHSATETSVTMSALDLVLFEKQVRGSLLRFREPTRRHPAFARPLPRGPAQPRRPRHQDLPVGGDQRRLSGDARRREHPRRPRLRLNEPAAGRHRAGLSGRQVAPLACRANGPVEGEKSVKSRAAVLWGLNEEWKIEEIEVDPPKAGEVLVQWKAAGMCHSDEHLVTGDLVPPAEVLPMFGVTSFFPAIGGHEGAGIVREVGPGVSSVKPGDHVSASFVPSCGRCRSCSTGKQNLCDNGAGTLVGGMITDGTSRHHLGEHEVTLMAKLGTFSEYACVAENSLIKVDDDYRSMSSPSSRAVSPPASARRSAGRTSQPGDTVVVVGVGGIGINAVQGAKMAGAKRIIAIDPVEFKREKAMEFGATHTFSSMEEALPAVQEITWGQMADQVIMTPGVMYGDLMQLGMSLTTKGGTLVVTAVAPMTQTHSAVNLFDAGDDEQGDQGHDLRIAQPARRHPPAALDVPRRPAQARRTDHQALSAGRDQRGLPGDARRREHPRRHRL